MRTNLPLLLTILISTIQWPLTLAMPTYNSNLELILLHTNDMHARFDQTDALSKNCSPQEAAANKCYGGFARIAQKVREFRNGSTPVLYLDAGDTYTGTPWFNLYQHEIVTDFMNLLKPDATCLGNHEFDKNIFGLVPYLLNANYPIVTANLDLTNTPELATITNLRNSTVVEVNGVLVGIVGYLTPRTKFITPPNDVGITDEVAAINLETEKLRQQGVKIIIAVGHSGFAVDKSIGEQCADVDVVIGGHDNTFLWNGPQPDLEIPIGPYPTIVTQASGKQVPVMQAYAFTKYLGYLKITFDINGNLVSYEGQPILLDASVPQDPEALTRLDKYRAGVEHYEQMMLGESRVFLNGSCKFSECNLGNFLTDAMIDAYVQRYIGSDHWSDCSIALMNSGGIRTSGPTGNFSMADLLTILPFDDELVTIQLIGADLVAAMEHSVHRYSYTIRRGEYLQMSGLQVVFNLTQPSGSRVASLKVLCTDCLVPRYDPVEVNRMYKVLTTTYLAYGGDEYDVFTKSEPQYVGIGDIEAPEEFIRKMHFIYPGLHGRSRFIGQLQVDDDSTKDGEPGRASILNVSWAMAIGLCLVKIL